MLPRITCTADALEPVRRLRAWRSSAAGRCRVSAALRALLAPCVVVVAAMSASPPARAQAAPGATGEAKACAEAVQGRVSWSRNPGTTAWQPGNLASLCDGSTNHRATIACFQAQIAEHGEWPRAIAACKAGAPAANAANAATRPPTPAPQAPQAPQAPSAIVASPALTPAAPASTGEKLCQEADYIRTSDKNLGDVCYKTTSTRGAGVIPTACPDGTESQGGLCYPKCRAGHRGAVTMCVPECPAGFRDDGLHCAKGAPYGRGAGYAWQFGDALNDDGMIRRCERDHGKGGCEKNGLIFYPKCKAGFVAVGANVCSPQCPAGMVDIGVSCQKVTYDRGVGKIPVCPAGLVNDAGLCYPPCGAGTSGVGPVCWANQCPADYPVACGAMCARAQHHCTKVTTTMVTSPVKAIASTLGLVLSGGATAPVAPLVENAEREAYKEVRIQSLMATLQSRAKAKQCTLTGEAARMAATGIEALEKTQGVTDYMARADPTSISTIIDAYAKPICK